MVRKYQRKFTNNREGKSYAPYQSYTQENLLLAIQAMQEGTVKLSDAAKTYNVPKSTLSRKYRNINCTQEKAGHPTLFSIEEERSFVQKMIVLSQWGFPFDTTDLRVFAQKYLNKIGKKVYELKDNMPGVDWARNFLARHANELSNRKAANISTDRAKITPEIIDNFLTHYTESVESVTPDCIINFDETNLTDDPGSKNYIYKRGTKYPERVVNSSKTAISLMFSGTADGHALPIYVVYKAEHLWDTWVEEGPVGTRYNRSKSGWFDSVCFEDWFNTIIVPYAKNKPGRKVVIGDNLSSHFSENVLKICKELDIAFVCLPPKTTHLLQPLDVAFFAPLKAYWRDVLTHWKMSEGRKHKTLIKSAFPKLLQKLKNKMAENGAESNNLIAGFNKSGLYPINPDRPKSRLPQKTSISNEEINDTASAVITDMLNDLRVPLSTPVETRRKKRCYAPAGTSITLAHYKQNKPQTTIKPKQGKRKSQGKKVSRKTKKRKSSVNSAQNDSDETMSGFDSDATRVMDDEDTGVTSAIDDISRVSLKPIPGPSGMCKNKSVCVYSCDDLSEEEIAPGLITFSKKQKQSKKSKSYKGKGKGIGKKSKTGQKFNKETTQINTNTSDPKDLDSDILQKIYCDTTIGKIIANKRKRKSKDSTTTFSDSDIMSKHSDSDLNDYVTDAHSSDLFDDEYYNNVTTSVTKDIVDVTNTSETAEYGEIQIAEFHDDATIRTNQTAYSNEKNKSAENCKTENVTNVKTIDNKLVIINDKTDSNQHTNEPLCENLLTESNLKRHDAEMCDDGSDLPKRNDILNAQDDVCDDSYSIPTKLRNNDENDQNSLNVNEVNIAQDEENLECRAGSFYDLSDNVLVRYFNRKKWSYYVGFIEAINQQGDGNYTYTVRFFKTIKKPQLTFRKTKRLDRDVVQDLCILKRICLTETLGNPNELRLENEADQIYFLNV